MFHRLFPTNPSACFSTCWSIAEINYLVDLGNGTASVASPRHKIHNYYNLRRRTRTCMAVSTCLSSSDHANGRIARIRWGAYTKLCTVKGWENIHHRTSHASYSGRPAVFSFHHMTVTYMMATASKVEQASPFFYVWLTRLHSRYRRFLLKGHCGVWQNPICDPPTLKSRRPNATPNATHDSVF